MNIKLKITGLWILVLFSACRKEKQLILEESEIVTEASPNASPKGFYLLNEGNMNANKASLDYLDFTTGKYRRNIYAQINPEITKGLGDVGNDLKIYGSKLYAVLNVSNKIEVLDVKSGRRITQIDLNNCRYITFHKNKAYVSAYLGNIGDPSSPQGIVAEIDTATLTINRKVKVGRQPEEMAVVGNKLYVANSGGYSPPDYETTISVIDIPSFSETEKIPVAINLHRLKADKYGDLYVSSRGDYYDIPSQLFVIETQNHTIKKTFDIPVSEIIIQDDLAYIYSSTFNYQSGTNYISYRMLDVKNETILDRSFITDGTNKKIIIPYGIAVNPQTKEIFITDARDYVTPGVLYCFNSDGKLKWSVGTGDIPAHFAFVY
jgi:DNA-binding beta-propeller fold protein YncE